MKCSSCGKQKANLSPKKSRLAGGLPLFLCNTCIDGKFEPRYLIIIHGRKNGFDSVSDYIKQRRYVGEDILAQEFV